MSARLRCCLLSTVILMMAPAAIADPTMVNFDFGAVPILCSNGYAYQGSELYCPYTGPTQNFNSAPGFGWTLGPSYLGDGSGVTGPGTVFYPPSFTGLPFSQAVFLQGQDSSVSQAISGFKAGTYALSFYLGSRFIACCGYDGNQTVAALIDGQVIGTWVLTSFTPFTLETVPFTVATGGTHTLEFRGMSYGDHTAFLSYVRITKPAVTWDATKNFAASNPNGAWSYGEGITGTSFTLYTIYNPNCWPVDGVDCWTAETYGSDPFVGFNTTGEWLNWSTAVIPPDVLNVSPGPDSNQDTIVRWTAPVAGYYSIAGFFEILDTNPTGIIGLVFRNGTQLYRGELLGPPAQHPNQLGGREYFYFDQLFLNAGDVLSFGVNQDGDFHYDTTGFTATITMPSTPCTACSQ